MNNVTEEELIDYLAGELSPARAEAVTTALAADPALAAELEQLRELFVAVRDLPEPAPSAEADARFAALLANAAETTRPQRSAKIRSLVWKVAGVAAAIALVFTAGRFYEGAGTTDADRQLAATRALMLELMRDDRTSARIKATTVTFELAAPDPVTTENLGYLLRNDADNNVRLAALTALRRFAADPAVRNELLRAMEDSPPEVVRIELIETLVRVGEARILPYLENLIETDSIPRKVKDLARLGTLKLI